MNILLDLFKTKIVIVGNGDFAREVADTAIDNGLKVIGFIGKQDITYRNIKTLGDDPFYLKELLDVPYLIGIGDCHRRESIDLTYTAFEAKPFTLISKRASIIGTQNHIGEGTIIQPGVILTNRITIGRHVILNLNTTIGHDAVVENYCNLSPGCHINGHTDIWPKCNLGSGTVTIPKAVIGKNCIIGAGAVVKGSIEPDSVAVGAPAKVIRKVNI